jgi:hypothetical protein
VFAQGFDMLSPNGHGLFYADKAAKALAVISSTPPVPLMARYFGADWASSFAQFE